MRFRVYALLLCAVLGPLSSAEVSPLFSGEVMTVEQALDRIEQTTGRDYKPGDFQHWLVYLNTKDLAPEEVLEAIATAVRGNWSGDPERTNATLLPIKIADLAPEDAEKALQDALPSLSRSLFSLKPEDATRIQSELQILRRYRWESPAIQQDIEKLEWEKPEGRFVRAMLEAVPAEEIIGIRPGERVVYGTVEAEGVRKLLPRVAGRTTTNKETVYRSNRRVYEEATGDPGLYRNLDVAQADQAELLVVLKAQGRYGLVQPKMALVLPDGRARYHTLPTFDFKPEPTDELFAEGVFTFGNGRTDSQKESIRRQTSAPGPNHVTARPLNQMEGGNALEHVLFETKAEYFDSVAARANKPVVSYFEPFFVRLAWIDQGQVVVGRVVNSVKAHEKVIDPALIKQVFERSNREHSPLTEESLSPFLTPTGTVSDWARAVLPIYAPYLMRSGPNYFAEVPFNGHGDVLFRSLEDRLKGLDENEYLGWQDLSPIETYWLKEVWQHQRRYEPSMVDIDRLPVKIRLTNHEVFEQIIWAQPTTSGIFYQIELMLRDDQLVTTSKPVFVESRGWELRRSTAPAAYMFEGLLPEDNPLFVRSQQEVAVLRVQFGEDIELPLQVSRQHVPEPTKLITLDEVISELSETTGTKE
jgi:hypothetical protein